MKNSSPIERRKVKSQSFLLGESNSTNSSFTILPDGTIKKRRYQSSYKDIYLNKVNYRSTHKMGTYTHNSRSYSKYNHHKRLDTNEDNNSYSSLSIVNKSKANNTTLPNMSSSANNTTIKTCGINLYSTTPSEVKAVKRNHKSKDKLNLNDVFDFNYPLQISQNSKEIKVSNGNNEERLQREQYHDMMNANEMKGDIEQLEGDGDNNEEEEINEIYRYFTGENKNQMEVIEQESSNSNRNSNSYRNRVRNQRQTVDSAFNNEDNNVEEYIDDNGQAENNNHDDDDYLKTIEENNNYVKYENKSRNSDSNYKKEQKVFIPSDEVINPNNNVTSNIYKRDQYPQCNLNSKSNTKEELNNDDNNEFLVEERDNNIPLNNNKDFLLSNGSLGNNDFVNEPQLLYSGSDNNNNKHSTSANRYNDEEDDEDNPKNKEECHQISPQFNKETSHQYNSNNNKAHKINTEMNEIIEVENDDTLLNSLKMSNLQQQKFKSSNINCNKSHENISAISMSNNGVSQNENTFNLIDNKMNIEELSAMNNKSKNKMFNESESQDQYKTISKLFKSTELKSEHFDVNISYKKKDTLRSTTHFYIEIKTDLNKNTKPICNDDCKVTIRNQFKGIIQTNTTSLCYSSNKLKGKENGQGKILESVQYSISLIGNYKKKINYHMQKGNNFIIEADNKISKRAVNPKEFKCNEDEGIDYNEDDDSFYNQKNLLLKKEQAKNNNVLKSKNQKEIKQVVAQDNEDENCNYMPQTSEDKEQRKSPRYYTCNATPIISVNAMTMPNCCVQKKNSININKLKEAELSNVHIDDLIDQIKQKHSKKKSYPCKTNKIHQHNKTSEENKISPQLMNDSLLKANTYETKGIFQQDSLGNMPIIDKHKMHQIVEMLNPEKFTFNNNDTNNAYLLGMFAKKNKEMNYNQPNQFPHNIDDQEILSHHRQNTKSRQTDTNGLIRKDSFVMPANTLETLLAKREEMFFNPITDTSH